MPWEKSPGVHSKIFRKGNQQIRILDMFDDFEEESWCEKGHVGYILEGSLTIDYDGHPVEYKAGDGLWIEAGKASRHKALIPKGGRARLLLFEQIV